MSTDANPTTSSTRLPKISRLRTSRPNSSVPSQWRAVGPMSLSARTWCAGSYGERYGAHTATATRTPMIAPPPSARWFRRNRRHIAAAGERYDAAPRVRPTTGRVAIGPLTRPGGADTGTPSASARSSVRDAGIEVRVRDVHRQVRDDERRGEHQHPALQQNVVTR